MRLVKGHKYTCKVINILSYGAVVAFEDGSTELLHISNVADTFVKDIHNFVEVGKSYEVTAVPGKIKKLEITMRSVDVKPDEDEKLEDMSFGDLLDMYPPTNQDLRNKRDYHKSKKRR